MSWSQNPHQPNPYTHTPGAKQVSLNHQPPFHQEQTAVKNETNTSNQLHYDQFKTPTQMPGQPKRALIFFGNNKSKHLFPLYRDEEIGIGGELQRRVHHSSHDDDKMTTTTQLGLAISQTCDDLYEILQYRRDRTSGSSFTQIEESFSKPSSHNS